MDVKNRHTYVPQYPTDVYIGRPSPLGNPFRVAHSNQHVSTTYAEQFSWLSHEWRLQNYKGIQARLSELSRGYFTRDDAVELCKWHFRVEIKLGNKELLEALEDITEDSTLVCWCAPLRCHAEVVRLAWEWLQDQKEQNR